MRSTPIFLAVTLSIAAAAPAPAQAPATGAAGTTSVEVAPDVATGIAAVIEDQIAAFLRSDIEAAWIHASPTIQGRFGTAERFGAMVRQGYPMVWRPAHWEMRGIEAAPEGYRQTVLFQDAAGQLHIAEYDMRLIDGVWRINGVRLRPAPGVGA